ncbi:putative fluoride ion transporter CrcB [Terrihabitans soli]|uniref:Fluoride-specific ion channel FluC n=1 Tax=Terrihabitans soli TaxID=708113 RepID=A0A6S6QX99_9HYPH|nr:fluoride efflux transporter CrcB [Terrihabitans soli]BCJ91178.1 putative fluoride ion transporter CrcB [Terrihabitans soli]
MQALVLVFIGGGLGAAARHLFNLAAARLFGIGFPWGTFGVNVIGGLAMGLLTAWLASRTQGTSEHLRLFLATGILGGFTTFSAYSLDAVVLWERGAHTAALFYVVASVVLAIGGVAVGLAIGRAFA